MLSPLLPPAGPPWKGEGAMRKRRRSLDRPLNLRVREKLAAQTNMTNKIYSLEFHLTDIKQQLKNLLDPFLTSTASPTDILKTLFCTLFVILALGAIVVIVLYAFTCYLGGCDEVACQQCQVCAVHTLVVMQTVK